MTERILWPMVSASITVGLFLLMGYLITPKNTIPTEVESSPSIDISRVKRDEKSPNKARPKVDKPKKINTPPPPLVARPRVNNNVNSNALLVSIPTDGVDIGGLDASADRSATPIVRFPPQYPQGPLQRNIEGWVLVNFTITHTGTVGDEKVVESEPKGTFDRAALRAIKRWKYQPKMENGKSVPQYNMREIFRFEIQDS